MSGPLQGEVLSVAHGVVSGWACFPGDSARVPYLVVYVDEVVVAGGAAATLRLDLKPGTFGEVCYGFDIALPAHVVDGGRHALAVREAMSQTALETFSDTVVLVGTPYERRAFSPDDLRLLFDADYYSRQVGATPNPLSHYMSSGWRVGANPHPLFDTAFYAAVNRVDGDEDPLSHFFMVGRWRLFETHPLFDVAAYAAVRPDVVATGLHPLLHYVQGGWREQSNRTALFDGAAYGQGCASSTWERGSDALTHYLAGGWREGVRPHPDVNLRWLAAMTAEPLYRDPYTQMLARLACRGDGRPSSAGSDETPELSIIILNLDKPLLCFQCVYCLLANTDLTRVEIIIVDNGSSQEAFATLCRLAPWARILRLEVNRGFGEANNLAVDEARGAYVLFLNNDVFVTPGWLPPLFAALGEEGIGAAGPKFMFPDGRLQEAGALVLPCGAVTQRGKWLGGEFDLYDAPAAARVDYVSAATLLMRTADFRRCLGFDLCWDPVYYEDTDLCLKLRVAGLDTAYVAGSVVVHMEYGTSGDPALDLRLSDVAEVNRLKFASRWGAFLAGRSDGAAERGLIGPAAAPVSMAGLPTLGLYSPYPLTPGGGERYLLSIAHLTRGLFDCTLVTPERYSRSRLRTMGRELELSLEHVGLARPEEAGRFDVFVGMGNAVLPPTPGLGRINYFHCQFPFPMEDRQYSAHWRNWSGYDGCVVNSQFTRGHLLRAMGRLGLPSLPVHVLHPPIPQIGSGGDARFGGDGGSVILHIGRFTSEGHCKRQDVMIEAFRELAASAARPVELHLAGAAGADREARQYLLALRKAALGLPVRFHVNVDAAELHALCRRSLAFWQLTGVGSDIDARPEVFEHFGIAAVEAMSAGAIPVMLRHGGPSEIVVDGWSGFLVDGVPGLLGRTRELLRMDAGALRGMSAQARERAAQFGPEQFRDGVLRLLGEGAGRGGFSRAASAFP